MKRILIMVVFIILGTCSIAKEVTKMKEIVNGKEIFYENSVNREETEKGYILTREYGKEEVEVFDFTKEGILNSWLSTKDKASIFVVREGNTLKLTATVKKEKIEKNLSINENVWYGSPTTAISDMVKNGKKSIIFWMIAQNDLTARELVASIEGEEKILGINTYRVKITLMGMLSMLWSANYWVDKTDGDIIRYKGTRGPGTPESIIEIVK